MPFQSLREYLESVAEYGDLLRIDGADREEEIGALAEIVSGTSKSPMILFDKIKGYPEGYRVSANTLGGIRRMALALGLNPDLNNVELVRAWKEKLKSFQPVHPREVKKGAVKENVFLKDEINLLKFPAPKWHELDGGYYLGTGCCVILRDPDEGWVNMGVYRIVVHDEKSLGIFINHIQQACEHIVSFIFRG